MKTDKIQAAIRDPKTGKLYMGDSHAEILEELEESDRETQKRIRRVYIETGKLNDAPNVGFVKNGEFLTRAQSLKKWGVFQSNDLRYANER